MATLKQLDQRLGALEQKLSRTEAPSDDVRTDVVKLLTEDIQAHRDYIQKLYRSAATVGGIIVAAGAGLAYWILGEQLDAKVFEYRIVDALRAEAQKVSEVIVSDAKLEAQRSVKAFVKSEISNEAERQISTQLASLNEESLTDLVKRITFPAGMVVATVSDTCPTGWIPFSQATGRVLVGSGTFEMSIDDGLDETEVTYSASREIWNLQGTPHHTFDVVYLAGSRFHD